MTYQRSNGPKAAQPKHSSLASCKGSETIPAADCGPQHRQGFIDSSLWKFGPPGRADQRQIIEARSDNYPDTGGRYKPSPISSE
jgi:hypothetical protein